MNEQVTIHPTAIISPQARLGTGVAVGPYAVLDGSVEIGDRTRIDAHAVLTGEVVLGADCRVFPHAVIGAEPQDLKYRGEPARVVVGRGVNVREFVTIHRGTESGGGVTRIGDHCLLMATAHVAHDCALGDHVIMANGAALGGHVQIAANAILGGLVGVHQFVRIGRFAFIGGCSAVAQDVAPFVSVAGNRAQPHGLNLIGLQRKGFSREVIRGLKRAYELLFRSGLNTTHALAEIGKLEQTEEIRELAEFVRSSERGICK